MKDELVECGHCDAMIKEKDIASFGADHHDPAEMMCWDCFNGAISNAEALNDN